MKHDNKTVLKIVHISMNAYRVILRDDYGVISNAYITSRILSHHGIRTLKPKSNRETYLSFIHGKQSMMVINDRLEFEPRSFEDLISINSYKILLRKEYNVLKNLMDNHITGKIDDPIEFLNLLDMNKIIAYINGSCHGYGSMITRPIHGKIINLLLDERLGILSYTGKPRTSIFYQPIVKVMSKSPGV